jgi:hypothetical protein
MQSSRYLVPNRITVVANQAGHVTEYNSVYQRNITVYKGIDNVLEFRLKNPDQKPIDTTTVTPKFVVFDENRQQVIPTLTGEVLDDGSTQTRGLFKITIPENELLNIKQQYLTFTIYLENTDGSKTLTYANEWMDAAGVIYVSSNAFPGPAPTLSVSTFTENNSVWESETIDAQPELNSNTALHTAVIYPDNFSGVVKVLATLDDQIVGNQNITWTEVASVTMLNETTPMPVNFYGVFSHIRFTTTSNPADKISKILVRN